MCNICVKVYVTGFMENVPNRTSEVPANEICIDGCTKWYQRCLHWAGGGGWNVGQL